MTSKDHFESSMLHFASQRGGSIRHDGRLAQHRFSFRFSRTSFLQTKSCPMKTTPPPFLTSACATAALLLLCAASLSAAPGLRREIWDNLAGPAEVQLSDRPSFFGPPLTLTTSEAFYGPPATADILANALSPNIYGGTMGRGCGAISLRLLRAITSFPRVGRIPWRCISPRMKIPRASG